MTIPNVDMPENETPVITGDWLDDDGQVMDDLMRNQSDPPEPEDLPVQRDSLPDAKPLTVTRLMCRNYAISAAATDPVMFLPADPNRTSLVLQANGTLVWSGDRNDLNGEATLGFILKSTNIYALDGYTGAVWAIGYDLTSRSVGAAGIVYLDVMAVTS